MGLVMIESDLWQSQSLILPGFTLKADRDVV
jgi:hypothetical protein